MQEIKLPFESSVLNISIIQIEGPSSGKNLTFFNGRDTFQWKSKNEKIRQIKYLISLIHLIPELI